MRYVKWAFIFLFVTSVGGILYYTLPRHEVVRIVGVETRLETLGINRIFYSSVPTGMADSTTRDVRYIETLRANGSERVFRNEDTGWGWPPVFKMNSADMQARARDLVSTADAPRWVRVTTYGMRSRLISTYPNVIRLTPVDSPDASTLPITRIIGFLLLGVLSIWLYIRLRRLREETIEPFFEEVGERREAAQGRARRWIDRILGR